ncbi:MAG: TetR/AcrR family transcriptional regulator [Gemmatimonadota bacterium]|nr:MAG: TetR/AcrR family transcriptional regulator [Gemmatimonadota bacterium]
MSEEKFFDKFQQIVGCETDNGAVMTNSTHRVPRKEREKERHRQDVLGIAETLLTHKSYREITMQEIAAEAEFSVGYLYKLFPNKESIFISLLRHKHESLMSVIEEKLNASLDFKSRFTNVVNAIFSWLNDNMDYATSSLRDLHALAHTDAGLSSDWLKYQTMMHTRFEAFFSGAVQEGVLTEEKPHTISKTFRAIMWGFIRERLLYEDGKKDWTEETPTVVNVIMRAFSPRKGYEKNESA